MVTTAPAGPLVGEMFVMETGCPSVKGAPALVTPYVVTVMEPLVAPDGTVTVMLVSVQLVIPVLASTPLNFTNVEEVVPDVKPVPASVTDPPTGAAGGDTLVMTGLYTVRETVRLLPMLLATTVTGPVVAVDGTVATICELLQLVTLAA